MLLGILDASLLEDMLAGKGINRVELVMDPNFKKINSSLCFY